MERCRSPLKNAIELQYKSREGSAGNSGHISFPWSSLQPEYIKLNPIPAKIGPIVNVNYYINPDVFKGNNWGTKAWWRIICS
jgi:hypothetical protein